ncbi:MAG: DUF1150 family protein [Pseudomonadota bacterium]
MTYETETMTGIDLSKIAYIRAIEVNELRNLPSEALETISDPDALFVLTTGEGQKLAIVEGRDAAFKAAEMNSLTPLSVH